MTTRQLLGVQARVIAALILRETRAAFGTSQIGYLWAIITPAASVGLLVFIFSLIDRQPPFGASLALFFATGILTLEFFNKLSNTLMTAFDANKALLTYPLIKETDALFARLILISVTYTLIMLLFYGSLCVLGLADVPAYPERLLMAFASTAFLGFGFGTLNAVIMSLFHSWSHIEKVLTRPLFLLSGIFYIPSLLPPEAIAILRWNPVLHLIEWVRSGYYINYESTVLDQTYPIGLAVLMTLLGLSGERLFRKKRV
ncbi:ABC transporter permease [Yoonia sp. BS5-3]|uniref:ABC transporter permease n=1 Tax=Yoonia phaeophyticola TaxID=3137369 RepID=A0ABZ2V488_9RHOB